MSPRPSADNQRIASYGRGGAGNFGRDDPTKHTNPNDLVTPTLKSDQYTTGRGGSGNIVKNDPNHPEIARASQDVVAPAHREDHGPHHYGRGGAGNLDPEAVQRQGQGQGQAEHGAGTRAGQKEGGLVDKAKALFNGKK
ncbi:hypothetical protein K491DRAFT_595202 [Lophiostoma macrostomum CBS 122681]|uniref:Uncharacterized protein n=1 Tax=Lophiostoma macrostomum CBS 122681 TaxID=1314788 RepID=A0A6A6TD86_9PLEO|nr:hypothetical protein K491DRAFT_595202 [Lophiostoma macrostomum CBS 122681]